MNFIEKIKGLRSQKGISQLKMAELLGISQTGYSKIEKGKTDISLSQAVIIAKTLNISFNELFEIESTEDKLLTNKILEQNKLISLLEEQNEILKDFRLAFIQERTISELMVYATSQIVKEQYEKGEKPELTSFEVRKRAIAIYQKEYPDIELNPYLNLTPGEMQKK